MQFSCAALYCHLWYVWLYHIFPQYLIKGTIFEKKINIKYVFWFFLQHTRVSENFLTLRKIQLDNSINILRYSCKYQLFLSDFNQIWNFSIDFRKKSNIKFHKNLSSGRRFASYRQTDRRTDRHDEAIVALRYFVNASKTFGPSSQTT